MLSYSGILEESNKGRILITTISKNNWLKQSVRLFIQLAVLGYIIYYLFSRKAELTKLWSVSFVDAASIFLLVFLGNLIRSYELKYIVSILNAQISFSEAFYVTVGSNLLNNLPMNVGTIAKARVLKKHSAMKYAHFVSVMSAFTLITLLAGGALGIMSIAFSGDLLKTENIVLAMLFSSSIIIPILVLYIPASWGSSRNGWLRTALADMLDGWSQIRKSKTGILLLFITAVIRHVMVALRLWICFEALNTPVTIFGCIMFAVVSNLLLIVNITPGSLGLREVLIGAIAQFTGLDFQRGLFVASLDRLFTLLFAVVVGLPSLIVLKIKKMI